MVVFGVLTSILEGPGAVLEACEGVLEALGGVLEGLASVLLASWRPCWTKIVPRCPPNRKKCEKAYKTSGFFDF